MTRLSRIVVLLRNVDEGLKFYRDGLGLRLDSHSKHFARLSTSDGTAIELNSAESESQCSTGYSPFLTFEVEDMDVIVPKLMVLGAALDGPIRYESYGKIAAVRSPDGHMVGIIECANLPDDGDSALAAAAAAQEHLETDGKS